jgi:hypothetical protein
MYANVKKIPLKSKNSIAPTTLPFLKKRKFDQLSELPAEELRGRILATGTSITGLNTFFKEEVSVGDVLVIVNPQTHLVEERYVTDVLSNRNIFVHAKFSSDFVSTVDARVRREGARLRAEVGVSDLLQVTSTPSAQENEKTVGDREKLILQDVKKKIVERTSESAAIAVVEKSGSFGYKTRVTQVHGKFTNEDELNIRAKHKHDKYC